MDTLSPERRSALMRSVRQKNTTPESIVRKCAHRLGLRFRLNKKNLPGTPDLVFPKYRTVIFVHGCFWHRHPGCRHTTTPSTRKEFWQSKFAANIDRDSKKSDQLKMAGWRVFVIWECETKDKEKLVSILSELFNLPTKQQ